MDHKPSIQILNLALIKKRQLVPAKKAEQEGREHWRHQLWGTGARAPPGAWTCKKIWQFLR